MSWPKTPSLSDVEDFISDNKHLPDVPSIQEIAENGYSQHEMNRNLLQKIEELTQYTIEQHKEITEPKVKLEKRMWCLIGTWKSSS